MSSPTKASFAFKQSPTIKDDFTYARWLGDWIGGKEDEVAKEISDFKPYITGDFINYVFIMLPMETALDTSRKLVVKLQEVDTGRWPAGRKL